MRRSVRRPSCFAATLSTNIIMALTLTASGDVPLRHPVDRHENGFIMLDVLKPLEYGEARNNRSKKIVTPIILPEEENKIQQLIAKGRGLKQFLPNFRFLDQKPRDLSSDPSDQAPWLQDNLDVQRETDAEKISRRLLLYILQGWFDDVDVKNYDSQFRANKQRLWCNTPWLNVTEKGREALHGLTKEFPIRSTTVYPDVPQDVDEGNLAVTWGSSFFNYKVCEAYSRLFKEPVMVGQVRQRHPQYSTPEGGVAFKLLFSRCREIPFWSFLISFSYSFVAPPPVSAFG